MGVNGVARNVKTGLIGVSGVARLCFEGGTPITTKAVGDIVQVAENGSPVDYIVVQIGTPNTDHYSECGRVLAAAEECGFHFERVL